MESDMECIVYKKGYKYQLTDAYQVKIPITPKANIYSPTGFIELSSDGILTVQHGYAWDGPSGPTIDTKTFMRGSLVHDALYQLMRELLLDSTIYRKPADKILRQICREDGMSYVRAWWVYKGVRVGARASSDPENKRKIFRAPKGCRD